MINTMCNNDVTNRNDDRQTKRESDRRGGEGRGGVLRSGDTVIAIKCMISLCRVCRYHLTRQDSFNIEENEQCHKSARHNCSVSTINAVLYHAVQDVEDTLISSHPIAFRSVQRFHWAWMMLYYPLHPTRWRWT